MTEISRPTMADDDGSLTSGTELDKDFFDDIMDEIDTQCHSATNPTVTPADTTDEVVAARGSKTDLDERLDVSLNEDGTLKTQASLVSAADAAELPQYNLVINDTFLIWAGGDSAEATCWTVAGTGAAVARAGTGLADTTRKVGDFCSKLTYGSATLTYYQELLDTTGYAKLNNLDGESVGFGAWVWASAASQARLYVADGATTTYSSYHTGGSGWEWLSLTHDLSGSATYLRVGISVESGAANPVYLSGPTALLSEVAPTKWRPARTVLGTIFFPVAGTVSVADVQSYICNRPGIVLDTQLYAGTGPDGDDLIVDINGNDGTDSMYSTLPQITDGATAGAAAPDGTYQYRCFAGARTATLTNAILNAEVTQVGSGTAGADLKIMVRMLVYPDPFEGHVAVLPDKAV